MSIKTTTIGNTVYINPTEYAALPLASQVSLISEQARKGLVPLVSLPPAPINIKDVNLLLQRAITDGRDFTRKLASDLNINLAANTQLLDAVKNQLDTTAIILANIQNVALAQSGYIRSGRDSDFEGKFLISENFIRRSHTSTGTEHQIHVDDFKRIFNKALSSSWGVVTEDISIKVRNTATTNRHTLRINAQALRVGCQTITRAEADYLATRLGFIGRPFNI